MIDVPLPRRPIAQLEPVIGADRYTRLAATAGLFTAAVAAKLLARPRDVDWEKNRQLIFHADYSRFVEVDGVPTPDLDTFIQAVAKRSDRSSLRLKTINWNNAVEVLTLKLDKHYWPTYELKLTPSGWRRVALD